MSVGLGRDQLLAPRQRLVAAVHDVGDQAGACGARQGHIVCQPGKGGCALALL